ncbi:MAG: HEAT repeat domain-containing protein [Deltaproteobacteria bacterium]|nr:HEAT repeat domain-containing protein [Deltaproteobacteria bacterium]
MSSFAALLPLLLNLPAAPELPAIPRSQERCSICGDGTILPGLEALLFAKRPEEQAEILRALGRTHSPLVRSTLRGSLTSSSAIVREAAIDGLFELGAYANTDELLLALDDREERVVIAATRALGSLPLPRVRARLSALASQPQRTPALRAAAIRSLLLHRTQESWAAATTARLADTSLAHATQAEANVAPPGEDNNEPRVSQALAALLAAPEVQSRVDAVALLSELRPIRRGLNVLDQIAAKDPAPSVRLAALELIASSTDSAAVLLLVHGADDRESDVRRNVLQHLSTSTRGESLHSMIALSRSANFSDVRSLSITALAKRPEPEAEARLEEVLVEREAPVLREALLVLRGKAQVAPRLVEAALPLALDPNVDRDLRSLALTLTARAHHPQVAELLLGLADGEDSLGALARGLLEVNYPEVYAEYQRNLPAPEAKVGFVLGSGAFSGVTLSLLGRIRDDSASATFLTATGGLALGVGAAYLIGGDDDLYGGPVSSTPPLEVGVCSPAWRCRWSSVVKFGPPIRGIWAAPSARPSGPPSARLHSTIGTGPSATRS